MNNKYLTGQLLSDYKTLGTSLSLYSETTSKAAETIQKINNEYSNITVDIMASFKGQTQEGIANTFNYIYENLNGVLDGIKLLSEIVAQVLQYYGLLMLIEEKDKEYYSQSIEHRDYKKRADEVKNQMYQLINNLGEQAVYNSEYGELEDKRNRYLNRSNDAKSKMDKIEKEASELVTKAQTLRDEIITKDGGYTFSPIATPPQVPGNGTTTEGVVNEWGWKGGWDAWMRGQFLIGPIYNMINPTTTNENDLGVDPYWDDKLRNRLGVVSAIYGWINPLKAPTIATTAPGYQESGLSVAPGSFVGGGGTTNGAGGGRNSGLTASSTLTAADAVSGAAPIVSGSLNTNNTLASGIPSEKEKTNTGNALKPKGNLSQEKVDFANNAYSKAIELEEKYGIPAQITFAQACLETGHGEKFTAKNNIFNIKDFSNSESSTRANVKEYDNGKETTRVSSFKTYDSYEESYKSYAELLKRKYQPKDGKSVDEWFKSLKKNGYATDPNYINKLKDVLNYWSIKY